jgi:acyl-coenzyme A synthetase/AMP-(fatty) acid ligase
MRDDETVLILHSSGTTGLPKLVYMKAGVFRVAIESNSMPTPAGRRNTHNEIFSTRLLLSVIAFSNAYGATLLVRSLYFQAPLALTPTAALLLNAIANLRPTAASCTPITLEAICDLPGGLDALAKLDHVFYGGFPLTKACGDRIARVTRLANSIGSTETFNLLTLLPRDHPAAAEDWEYLEWNPHAGIVMEPALGDDRMAELVIHREAGNEYQTVFHNFPDLSEWRTNDLYERHPTKDGLWKCLGRMNDLVVLSSGEKMLPVMFERVVARHPWVRGALVVGAGQVRAGLIVEPEPEQAQLGVERFIDEVWPWVEEANGQCAAYARVSRSMVCLATPGKPFKCVPKGLVMRKAMYGLYEEEIKRLYDRNV